MSWERVPPPIFEGEDELQLKLQYAGIVARNPNAKLTAGYTVFPGQDNYGRAMQAQAWLSDPIVQEEIARIRDGDPKAFVPEQDAKVEQVAWEIAEDRQVEPKDRIAALKLIADVRGMIQKGGTNVTIAQDNRVVHVLRVPARDVTPEDDADFDQRFYAQQTALIANAKSSRPAAAG